MWLKGGGGGGGDSPIPSFLVSSPAMQVPLENSSPSYTSERGRVGKPCFQVQPKMPITVAVRINIT